MAITTKPAIFLGTFADADTNESTLPIENSSVYLGNFNAPSGPLQDQVTQVTFDDSDNSGDIVTDNFPTPENISHSAGGTPFTGPVDSLAVVQLTVTYVDGSSRFFSNAVMFQDTSGNLFLANSNFAGTDLTSGSSSPIDSVNVTNIQSSNFNTLFQNAFQPFVCFASGTLIATPGGARRVEDLAPGDMVSTFDGGAVPLIWCGHQRLAFDPSGPSAPEAQKPIEIKPGALGQNLPARRLIVSPQHRILVEGDTGEALALAKGLLPAKGVRQMKGCREVVYHSLLCQTHQVLIAEGVPAESFYPGRYAMTLLSPQQRAEIHALLPALRDDPETGYGLHARPILKCREAETLAASGQLRIPAPPQLKLAV